MTDISVEVVETDRYISDHCPVISTLNIKKVASQVSTESYPQSY